MIGRLFFEFRVLRISVLYDIKKITSTLKVSLTAYCASTNKKGVEMQMHKYVCYVRGS